MLVTITSTTPPATDLGYLLYKNPARVQSFDLPFGAAHVFYPEATAERCTAALLLDIDPVHLVRGRQENVEAYVSDRPYVASSLMSVALAQVFGTALTGQSRERAELAATPLPLTARLAVVHARGGESILHRLFAPLGYAVTAESHPLDATFPEWGESNFFTVTLTGMVRLVTLLTHLYVLLPVLDDEKHYWIGDDEVAKLLRRGEGWLAQHPARALITQRYLRRRPLVRTALARLAEEDAPDPDVVESESDETDTETDTPLSLHDQRLAAVLDILKEVSAQRVLDLGCGEGRLLKLLLAERTFTHIVGMDVSLRALEIAAKRLRLDDLPPTQRSRIELLHGSLIYRDARLAGFDAAAVVEVIEHLDPARLAAFERVIFAFVQPKLIVLTTPNVEYNVRYPELAGGELRHRDHRFEWTRAEFRQWAQDVADRFGYAVRFLSVGAEDPEVGAPTQMAVFTR